MRIFNETKTTELFDIDYSKGKLISDTIDKLIPQQQYIPQKTHQEFETINNKLIAKTIIVENGQNYKPEHYEKEKILVYIPFTEKELKDNKTQKRISELKQKLAETDYMCLKFVDGEITQAEYAETWQKRKQWREEINKLEKEI